MNTFSLTEPWWFTERLLRKHLARFSGHVGGRVLDVGCGEKRYRDLFQCDEYIGVDSREGPEVDRVCDAHDLPFDEARFDSVVCNQVLEHVPDPPRVVREIHRALKPGGVLLLSVPFIGRLHGLPSDYWRFSEFGIRQLLTSNGFDVVQIDPIGGFWTTQCFLWLFATWELLAGPSLVRKALRGMIFPPMNIASVLVHAIDRESLTPFNYAALARKHSTDGGARGDDG